MVAAPGWRRDRFAASIPRVTALADRNVAAPPARGSRRRRRIVAVVVVAAVVLIAGAVCATVLTGRYRNAPPLRNDGGEYGWLPPDNLASRFVELGPYTGLVAPMRFGRSQAFAVSIANDSSVTQTVLGLPHDDSGIARSEHLSISVSTGESPGAEAATYRATPVSIPPHSTRYLRYTVNFPRCVAPSPQYWDSVTLRVRVGAFTRTETVTFSHAIFELTPPKARC